MSMTAPEELAKISKSRALPNSALAYRRVAMAFVEYQRWLIIGTLVVIGAALLEFYHLVASVPVLRDLVRDIGIAILVACVIAAIYETYARIHFELMLMNNFLDVVVSDWSRPDIWRVVKSQIIEKPAMRERLRIAIRLVHDDRIGDDRMLLKLNVRYELHGLRNKPTEIPVEHFLDSHLKIEEFGLPRFDYIQIGGKSIAINKETVNDNYEFSHKVTVPAQGDGAIDVVTMRQETVYIPGNHCFAMNEITRGVELCLEELPRGMTAFVIIRPHSHVNGIELKPDSPIHFKDDNLVLLPGQIIELVFQRTANAFTARRRTDNVEASSTEARKTTI